MRAQDATSTSYTVKGGSIGVEGGVSSSTSFTSFSSGDTMLSSPATSSLFSGTDGGTLGGESLASFAGKNWRWYGDEEEETPLVPKADEGVAPTGIWEEDPVKLRVTIAEKAEVGSLVKFRLEYSETSDFSGDVFPVVDTWACVATSTWCYADGAGVDSVAISTSLLLDADSCVAGSGDGCGTHNEISTTSTPLMHTAGAASEYEFTLMSLGAKMNTVYFFRLFEQVNASYVRLDAGETYPSLTTAGAELTFTVAGLPEGTATEGVVTDGGTSANAVSFGSLPPNVAKNVAQRLTIVTNAKSGYQVHMFGRQGLLNSYAAEIPAVTGTNGTPVGWGVGCDAGASGCFGYHAGDDSLFGGSTRFSPNDSFAALSEVAGEVAYSTARAVTDVVDIVFRALARNAQEAGIYESSVVYVVTPVF